MPQRLFLSFSVCWTIVWISVLKFYIRTVVKDSGTHKDCGCPKVQIPFLRFPKRADPSSDTCLSANALMSSMGKENPSELLGDMFGQQYSVCPGFTMRPSDHKRRKRCTIMYKRINFSRYGQQCNACPCTPVWPSDHNGDILTSSYCPRHPNHPDHPFTDLVLYSPHPEGSQCLVILMAKLTSSFWL